MNNDKTHREREPQVGVEDLVNTQNWIRGEKKKKTRICSILHIWNHCPDNKQKTLKWYHAELEEEGPEGSKS